MADDMPSRCWWVFPVMFALFLIAVPAVDLALSEPSLDESRGARCQLHANPAVGSEPMLPAAAPVAEPFLPLEPSDHLPLIGPSIFIPPRI